MAGTVLPDAVNRVARSLASLASRPDVPVSASSIEYALASNGIELPGVQALRARIAALTAERDQLQVLSDPAPVDPFAEPAPGTEDRLAALEDRADRLERRLAGIIENHRLWDGS